MNNKNSNDRIKHMLEKFKGETEQAQVVRFVCALGE